MKALLPPLVPPTAGANSSTYSIQTLVYAMPPRDYFLLLKSLEFIRLVFTTAHEWSRCTCAVHRLAFCGSGMKAMIGTNDCEKLRRVKNLLSTQFCNRGGHGYLEYVQYQLTLCPPCPPFEYNLRDSAPSRPR